MGVATPTCDWEPLANTNGRYHVRLRLGMLTPICNCEPNGEGRHLPLATASESGHSRLRLRTVYLVIASCNGHSRMSLRLRAQPLPPAIANGSDLSHLRFGALDEMVWQYPGAIPN